jgi:hypothetical protein
MIGVLPASATELRQLQLVGDVLAVLTGHIAMRLADAAFHDKLSLRHYALPGAFLQTITEKRTPLPA